MQKEWSVSITRHRETKNFIISTEKGKRDALNKAVRRFANEVGEIFGIFHHCIKSGEYDYKIEPVEKKEVEKVEKKSTPSQAGLFEPEDPS